MRDIPLRFSKIYELDARDLDRPIQDLIKAFIGRLGWPTTYSDDSPIQYAFWNERHHVLLNDAIPINRAGIHETDILIIGPKQS